MNPASRPAIPQPAMPAARCCARAESETPDEHLHFPSCVTEKEAASFADMLYRVARRLLDVPSRKMDFWENVTMSSCREREWGRTSWCFWMLSATFNYNFSSLLYQALKSISWKNSQDVDLSFSPAVCSPDGWSLCAANEMSIEQQLILYGQFLTGLGSW